MLVLEYLFGRECIWQTAVCARVEGCFGVVCVVLGGSLRRGRGVFGGLECVGRECVLGR